MKGRGGFWNRAGRRSGGARPTAIVLPRYPQIVTCPECGNAECPIVCTRGCKGCDQINMIANHARTEGVTLGEMLARLAARVKP